MKYLHVLQNKKIEKYLSPLWGNIKQMLDHIGSSWLIVGMRCIIVAQNVLWLVRVGHSEYVLGNSGT